jgi:hypothetical protein
MASEVRGQTVNILIDEIEPVRGDYENHSDNVSFYLPFGMLLPLERRLKMVDKRPEVMATAMRLVQLGGVDVFVLKSLVKALNHPAQATFIQEDSKVTVILETAEGEPQALLSFTTVIHEPGKEVETEDNSFNCFTVRNQLGAMVISLITTVTDQNHTLIIHGSDCLIDRRQFKKVKITLGQDKLLEII